MECNIGLVSQELKKKMLEISRENTSNDDDGGMLNGSEQKRKKNNLFRENI